MIKVIIIDDEPLARSLLKEYLIDIKDVQVIDECGDGFEGVKSIMLHKPDLIFLDVQMPKINGFEMLELLDYVPAVIFTTAFDQYAIKAFDAHAIDYLLKPFGKERLEKAIKKYLDTSVGQASRENTLALVEEFAPSPAQSQRVVVRIGGKIKIIPIQEISYLEADDDYVKIHTHEGFFLKNKTMAFFEKVLDADQFVRVHRSYILQISLITRIEPYEKDGHLAILKSGQKIPVSKSGYPKLKAVLGL
jgi:two-component system LytT family response regulator